MFAITPGKDYAVITGDIVDSSSLEAEQRVRLPGLIHEISGTLVDWFTTAKLTPVSVFAGDSWRILLADPADAMRVGLFLRASLLASPLEIDTRLVVAVGAVDFVPDGRLEEADGEAFRTAGRRLTEGMGRRSMVFTHHDRAVAVQWDLVFRLVETLIGVNWTAARARAVGGALRSLKSEEIGATLWEPPVTRQTIDRHLHEAGWEAVQVAVCDYEQSGSMAAP